MTPFRYGIGNDASGIFNIGISTIVWTVTDTSQNQSVCTTQVRINNPLMATIPNVKVPLAKITIFNYTLGTVYGEPNTVYKGYNFFNSQSVTLIAYASGGTKLANGNYKYNWSNGSTAQSIMVSPPAAGVYTYSVTITDSLGCQVYTYVKIKMIDVRCGPRNREVSICWNRTTTSCYSQNQAYLAILTGAQLGPCSVTPSQASMSKAVSIDPKERMDRVVSIVPNPNNGSFNIQLKNSNIAEIRIIDPNGRVVWVQQLVGKNIMQTIPVQLTNLSKGVYVLQTIGKDGMETFKVLIQ